MKPWPWEGSVQGVFATLLTDHGWEIESVADTARRSRGVDVLAARGGRLLGAEVKGYPSRGYENPSRANEIKRSSPGGQARAWYAKGVLAALILKEGQPERESLLVLPDVGRYRDLYVATATGLKGAKVHVLLLHEDGSYDCATWKADL